MFDVGAAGQTIIAVCTFVALILVGVVLIPYAAHCFLVTLEGTAAGNDDILWPDEPLVDWLWKGVFLLWMVGVWVVPIWLLVDVVLLRLLGLPAVGFFPAMVGVIWLLLPISLLSSLSGTTRWQILHLGLLKRLPRHAPALLLMYLMGGLLVLGAGALLFTSVAAPAWALLLLAAPAGAAVLLIYGRLLGRVAWLIVYRSPQKRSRKKRGKDWEKNGPVMPVDAPEPAPPQGESAPEPPAAPADTEDEDEWAPPKPYRLEEEAARARRQPAKAPIAPQLEKYEMRTDESPPAQAPVPLDGYTPVELRQVRADSAAGLDLPERAAAAVARFDERMLRPREEPAPARPLWSGVYTFPWYRSSARAWVHLSLFGLVELALLKLLLSVWPF
jgi:hypothetical protein